MAVYLKTSYSFGECTFIKTKPPPGFKKSNNNGISLTKNMVIYQSDCVHGWDAFVMTHEWHFSPISSGRTKPKCNRVTGSTKNYVCLPADTQIKKHISKIYPFLLQLAVHKIIYIYIYIICILIMTMHSQHLRVLGTLYKIVQTIKMLNLQDWLTVWNIIRPPADAWLGVKSHMLIKQMSTVLHTFQAPYKNKASNTS